MKAGLVLLGLLSVVDALGLLLTDGEHPPLWIAAVGTVLGLASLVLVVLAWRTPRPATVVGLLVLRVVSAATAVPAFLVPDVPTPAVVVAAAIVVLTLVGAGLVLSALRGSALRS
ncbi:hypothetical protein [Pseudonocardia oroxyli]|uniref:Uncharacterized protein n=1 Tax=Pseudonocardia oroxyli TaxID=366584 RepID=A0A1G7E098_PSEOR|nr:hypothetical protein [Pseudonocardia oroxyli]SDE57072.1 hypothetical protein SAMN05216377_101209 [Pseudonocardia oroxyli]